MREEVKVDVQALRNEVARNQALEQNRRDQESIDNWFTYHAPTPDQVRRYQLLRDVARGFAEMIVDLCPPCADRTAALRQLRECVMTANASIACNEKTEA